VTLEDRVGIGSDIHRLGENRPLLLGTVEVAHAKGLVGHSDGDVLCHAVADALLGAAALGEIGVIFPDDDPAWRDLRGSTMLEGVAARLGAAGWSIGNIDAVVQAEAPRLSPHRTAMARGIAAALGCDPERVSVKIKSNEGCDAIGRGEAIAALAVARIVAKERPGSAGRSRAEPAP
jgi:2-C-methyl-D-erythritol 2,4-cyclodiphosphate synthase